MCGALNARLLHGPGTRPGVTGKRRNKRLHPPATMFSKQNKLDHLPPTHSSPIPSPSRFLPVSHVVGIHHTFLPLLSSPPIGH